MKIGHFLFCILLYFFLPLKAQKNSCIISEDNRYMAIYKPGSGNETNTRVINVYKINTRDWIQSIEIEDNNTQIDEIGVNCNGQVVFARSGNNYTIWNVLTGTLVSEHTDLQNIAFSNHDNFYVTLKNGILQSYDSYSGEDKKKYTIPRSVKLQSISISDNDHYIIAKSNNERILIWRTFLSEILVNIPGFDIKLDTEKNLLMVCKNQNKDIISTIYEIPGFTKLFEFGSRKIIIANLIKEQDLKNATQSILNQEIVEERTFFSPDGNLLAIASHDPENRNRIDFFNTINGKLWYSITGKDFSGKIDIFRYSWINTDEIVIRTELSAAKFDIQNQRFVSTLVYEFDFGFRSVVDKSQQSETVLISPDYQYAVLPVQREKENELYLKNAELTKNRKKISDATFLAFSPNSNAIFFEQNDYTISVVQTSQLKRKDRELEPVDMKKKMKDRFKEPVIDIGNKVPENYDYIPLRNFKHISTLTDKDSARIYFKTIELGDSIGIQVHLIDKNGNYYYGASKPEWRKIWNKLLLQYPNGTIKETKDFKISETRQEDALPNAIAIVLDHSGSMGNERCLLVQKAAADFIKSKRPEDAMMIMKYDDRVKIDARLSADINVLLEQLEIKGDNGFGGSTALVDAANKAVVELRKQDDYYKKSIIILTDGNENSSLVPKEKVLLNSLKTDVSIFTIGLGQYISEHYLKTLSYNTKGSFYHIYTQKAFEWIFHDIYKKMKNYYTIKFAGDSAGTYTALIETKLIQNNIDTLITQFDNSPLLINKTDNEETIALTIPVITESETNKNNNEIINNFIKYISDNQVQNYSPNTYNLPYVEFVFDKTDITKKTRKNLVEVALFLKENPAITIEIHGHTDFMGRNTYNNRLSMQRAEKVMYLLIERGISKERVSIKYFGENKPKIDSKTNEARARNRRVEFYVVNAG